MVRRVRRVDEVDEVDGIDGIDEADGVDRCGVGAGSEAKYQPRRYLPTVCLTVVCSN